MNRRPRGRLWLVLPLLLLLAGCARAAGSSPAASSPPRVRCLSEGARDTAAGARPLFFLFCVESP